MKALLVRIRARPSVYVAMSALILLLDAATGEYLLFPILFVIPVVLAAWNCGAALAGALAIGLPLGRFAIVMYWELSQPLHYAAANAAVRIAVLMLIALLVARTARLTAQLEQRVELLVKMCAWTRTVEYQGEWISFEEYLKRRFNIDTTHGMSPAEAERQLQALHEHDT